jgi:vacuolar-type H+-ATPase subunit D/Vma8
VGDESSGFEAQAIEMNKKYGYARKAKDQLKHKNEKLCNRIDSLEQRIKGYEADLDGSTRLITAFRKAFTTVSGIVDGVMPNGGLGDDDDDAPF